MSLATDYLADYLLRHDLTQTEFALAAGMTATNLTDILKGNVEVSGRNLSKLLRGLIANHERDAFIAAYLRDQIPADQASRITVHISRALPTDGIVMESSDDETAALEAELAGAFATLPSPTYQRRVVRFLRYLRKDADLRDLFNRTMEYFTEDID